MVVRGVDDDDFASPSEDAGIDRFSFKCRPEIKFKLRKQRGEWDWGFDYSIAGNPEGHPRLKLIAKPFGKAPIRSSKFVSSFCTSFECHPLEREFIVRTRRWSTRFLGVPISIGFNMKHSFKEADTIIKYNLRFEDESAGDDVNPAGSSAGAGASAASKAFTFPSRADLGNALRHGGKLPFRLGRPFGSESLVLEPRVSSFFELPDVEGELNTDYDVGQMTLNLGQGATSIDEIALVMRMPQEPDEIEL